MAEMYYSEFVEVYDALYATKKKLEKISILAEFLKKLHTQGEKEWIYLLRGKVLADYDDREFGISDQLVIKALSFAYGANDKEILAQYKKIGDIGEIAENLAKKKKQSALFSSKLTAKKVYSNLLKIVDIEGKGAVGKKVELVAELLGQAGQGEAKYIARTLLGDLRVGVADALVRDALAEAFYEGRKDEVVEKIGGAFDLANDYALVFDAAAQGEETLAKITIVPGRPVNAMLAPKVETIEEAFEAVGKPAAIEHKYDGFRVMIHKKGEKVWLYTRRLENVTAQFPDVVAVVKSHIKGKDFILDSEVVGYDVKTHAYKPFEAISQRIKRKYEIEKLVTSLPVEINVFDVLYYEGESYLLKPFLERRKKLEKIITLEKWKIVPAVQLITDDVEKAQAFYENALKIGEEGIMVKKLDAPYQQGRRVGHMVKMKPTLEDLDLVIIGAEYGSGKRGGWLTSFILGCVSDGEFMEVGRVSSGLKEKDEAVGENDITYESMTELLKPSIIEEKDNIVKVKPKVVVSVTYQNIQPSPTYSSGYALRFPRITAFRPDRNIYDIATLEDFEREYKRMLRKGEGKKV